MSNVGHSQIERLKIRINGELNDLKMYKVALNVFQLHSTELKAQELSEG